MPRRVPRLWEVSSAISGWKPLHGHIPASLLFSVCRPLWQEQHLERVPKGSSLVLHWLCAITCRAQMLSSPLFLVSQFSYQMKINPSMMQRYLLRDIALQTHNPTLERLVCSFEARGPGVPGCITYLDAHKKLCCLNQGRWEGLISVVTGIGSGPSSNDSGKVVPLFLPPTFRGRLIAPQRPHLGQWWFRNHFPGLNRPTAQATMSG